jgi:hypothetical protein
VAEIEVCGSVFDLGDDELLDRIDPAHGRYPNDQFMTRNAS